MSTSLKICYAGTPGGYVVKDPDVIARLRALRLWHWNRIILCRARAVIHRRQGDAAKVRKDDEEASFHLTQVQTLNEFFELGDTAERDATPEFVKVGWPKGVARKKGK